MNTKAVVEMTAASSLARTLAADSEHESSPRRLPPGNLPGPPVSTNRDGNNLSRSESSSSDSVNSQDGIIQFRRSESLGGTWSGQGPPPIPCKPAAIKNLNSKKRQDELEQRHQELLARQRQLQEQYQRLQSMQQKANTIGPATSIRESVIALKRGERRGSNSSLETKSGSSAAMLTAAGNLEDGVEELEEVIGVAEEEAACQSLPLQLPPCQ